MSIAINGASESIQVVLDASPATNQLPLTASYVDQGGNVSDNSINSNGTIAVTLVSAPGASTQRVINSITIPNADTATRTVTVNRVISGTPFRLVKITLLSGYTLAYGGGHWYVIDPSGNFLENVTVTSGTLTSNQGSAATLSGAWPVEITDGSSILGTSTHPVRIDPTGTTTQPISGTVTTNPPANASTNVTQWGSISTSLGQKTSSSSVPVVIASDQSTLNGVARSSDFGQFTTSISSFTYGSSSAKYLNGFIVLVQSITNPSSTLTFKDGNGNTLLLTVIPAFTVSTSAVLYQVTGLSIPMSNGSNAPSVVSNNTTLTGAVDITVLYS